MELSKLKGKLSNIEEWGRDLDDLYFLLLALLLAFGTLQTAGSKTFLNTEKPVVTVISTSMCPRLQVGDILIVKGTNYSDIEEEQIIIFNVPDKVELEINGQEFQLNNSDREGSYAKSSPIGDVKLVKVLHNPSNENKDKIMIKINGKYIKKDGKRIYLVEGNKYNIGKNTITVNKISGSRRDIPIVHRVVEKNKDFLETKGDANPGQLEFEKHVKPEQIYGTILFRIPKIGLFKITTMDLLGLNGGKFLKLDTLPSC